MKRLILSLVAAAAVGGALPSGSASAGEGGHGRGGGGWAERAGGEGRGGGRWNEGPRYEAPPPRRGDEGGGRWQRQRPDPYAAPYEAPRPYGVRRGGYLPPEAGAPIIQDHSRYGLRAPPRGYTWVVTPRGYALVNEATGQIFDVVPGR